MIALASPASKTSVGPYTFERVDHAGFGVSNGNEVMGYNECYDEEWDEFVRAVEELKEKAGKYDDLCR